MHFTQGGVLTAHQRHILDPDLVKPQNESLIMFTHRTLLLEFVLKDALRKTDLKIFNDYAENANTV